MVSTITSSAVQILLMLTMVCRNLDGPRGPISGHLRQCKPRALAAKAHNSPTCPPRITPPTPCQVHVISSHSPLYRLFCPWFCRHWSYTGRHIQVGHL